MERVKDDRGGTVMTVDRLYRHLLQKLINANIDIDAYLQLRKAKGYMSVSENDHLRDNLFELCREMRAQAPRLQNVVSPEEKEALRLAGESLAAAQGDQYALIVRQKGHAPRLGQPVLQYLHPHRGLAQGW